MKFGILALLISSCLTFSGALESAAAQPNQPPPPVLAAYDAEIDRGISEFQAGNFAEARGAFMKAHQIFPNARTLRAIGKAEFELKNYVEAYGYLEQALSSEARALTAEQRADVQRLLERTRGYLTRYVVRLEPSDASLELDGTRVSTLKEGALVLPVGDHVLLVKAEGYMSERRELRVYGGGTETLTITLEKLAPVDVARASAAPLPALSDASAAPPKDDPAPRRKKRWWLWAGLAGAVVAGGAVATVLLLQKRERDDPPLGGTSGVSIQVKTSN